MPGSWADAEAQATTGGKHRALHSRGSSLSLKELRLAFVQHPLFSLRGAHTTLEPFGHAPRLLNLSAVGAVCVDAKVERNDHCLPSCCVAGTGEGVPVYLIESSGLLTLFYRLRERKRKQKAKWLAQGHTARPRTGTQVGLTSKPVLSTMQSVLPRFLTMPPAQSCEVSRG